MFSLVSKSSAGEFFVASGAHDSNLSDRAQIVSRGPFQGYDVIVCIIIFLHAAGGLIVATVMRYAGNIMKCFAISMSICACALLSTLTEPDISSVCAQEIAGIAIVLVSIFMFAL